MRVRVDAVDRAGDPCRVAFTCACGVGEASWVGGEPHVGDEREVELEVNESFTALVDLVPCDTAPGLYRAGERMVLVGRVALVDDSYVRLELGCGALDLEVTDAGSILGKLCRLETRELHLHDTRV